MLGLVAILAVACVLALALLSVLAGAGRVFPRRQARRLGQAAAALMAAWMVTWLVRAQPWG